MQHLLSIVSSNERLEMYDLKNVKNQAAAPWNGLGSDINSNMSLSDIQKVANLDWKVSKRLVRMMESRGSETQVVIPGYHAIVRDTDNRVFQVASDRYKLIQNDTILQFFKEYTEAGGMKMQTVGPLKDGAVVWALASIGKEFSLKGGDKVDGYMLLANSHDGSLSFNACFTTVRVVCMNTLQAALAQGGLGRGMFRMRHSKKLTDAVIQDAKNRLGLAVKEMEAFQEAAEFLSSKKVDAHSQQVMEYLIRLTQPNLLAEVADTTYQDRAIGQDLIASSTGLLDQIVEEQTDPNRLLIEKIQKGKITEEDLNRVGSHILEAIINSPGGDLPSAKGTWWGVLNGVTYHADHNGGRNQDSTLQSAWFGPKANLKERALELAIDYATGKVVKVPARGVN